MPAGHKKSVEHKCLEHFCDEARPMLQIVESRQRNKSHKGVRSMPTAIQAQQDRARHETRSCHNQGTAACMQSRGGLLAERVLSDAHVCIVPEQDTKCSTNTWQLLSMPATTWEYQLIDSMVGWPVGFNLDKPGLHTYLLKQVPDTGGTHTNKQLHEL